MAVIVSSPPQDAPAVRLLGLSEADVAARCAEGQDNHIPRTASRSYLQIVRHNCFSFINTILFAICVVLVAMGRLDDALLTVGVVLLNVVVGVVQESRAKRALDRIALLTRPTATVVREGQEQTIDPDEVVLGDVLVVRPGDQIVADGQVIGDGRTDVDESLLTGEADPVPKRPGDPVSSGSYCVSGCAYYRAETVGTASLVHQMTAEARAFRLVKTPLQRDIDTIMRVLVVLAAAGVLLLAGSWLLRPLPMVEGVRIAAVIVALVPQGLVAMLTVTYALAALRLVGKGIVIQQANAVESLSHVDLLCLDKTGTLTTNRLTLGPLHPVEIAEAEVTRLLGAYAASLPDGNRTAQAISAAYGGSPRPLLEQVPFSSSRRWSALASAEEGLRGVYVLGAPETLQPALRPGAPLDVDINAWAAQGLRVLLFAYRPEIIPLHDAQGQPQLPTHLIPLGVLSLREELRPDAEATLKGFAEAGVQLKIISGDHPHTVAALARQAGFGPTIRAMSGAELVTMDEGQFAQAAAEGTVFGRIAPDQKERLVRALQARGAYVAMIGDGVNDVPALKQADLGIALESGSQATRTVADIVLLGDAYTVLPTAFREGRRIIGGMQDIMRLLLARTLALGLVIAIATFEGLAFPMTPKQSTLMATLTVGLPTLALAVWARPITPPRRMIQAVFHFAVPAAVVVGVVGAAVYLVYIVMGGTVPVARTALATVTILCGVGLIPFVKPPTPAWAGGATLSGDWRPSALAIVMLVLLILTLLFPSMRTLFELTSLGPLDMAALGVVVVVAGVVLRWMWRHRLFERWLGLAIG